MPRIIYTLLLFLALPFVPLKLFWRGIKQPEYWQHWGERFGVYSTPVSKPVIWLHCVSVGETRAAAPLVDALQKEYPDYQILLTHTTPTGREVSEHLYGDSLQRVYLPYDLPYAVNKFLAHFNPAIGLLMETELWFNLIAACKCKNVPLLLLNARLSAKSAKGYICLGGLVKNGLQSLSAIAAQSDADAARIQSLGAEEVHVVGNLKFDVKPPEDSLEKGLALRKVLGLKRTVFLAASTREGEEALILEAVKGLNILTVIVPRHPQRFDEVSVLIEKRNLKYIRRSNLNANAKQHVPVVLGDSMGELYVYYAACDFAYIGGSLLKFGGQNLIEAASMGKPVLIGPHTFNFADASKSAIRSGAAILIKDVSELREKIQELHQNTKLREKMRKAALDYSKASTGASDRMMQLIKMYLN
ncbi:MAG: lipid IV(A) 3-deoxy-D-manno-octulosonic acid transferase [Methylophilaceae bacterium]